MAGKQKDTAYRPSQAHLEFVRRADGKRVRNLAYKGNKDAGKDGRSGSAMSDFKDQEKVTPEAEVESAIDGYDSLVQSFDKDKLMTRYSKDDYEKLSKLLTADKKLLAEEGFVVSGKTIKIDSSEPSDPDSIQIGADGMIMKGLRNPNSDAGTDVTFRYSSTRDAYIVDRVTTRNAEDNHHITTSYTNEGKEKNMIEHVRGANGKLRPKSYTEYTKRGRVADRLTLENDGGSTREKYWGTNGNLRSYRKVENLPDGSVKITRKRSTQKGEVFLDTEKGILNEPMLRDEQRKEFESEVKGEVYRLAHRENMKSSTTDLAAEAVQRAYELGYSDSENNTGTRRDPSSLTNTIDEMTTMGDLGNYEYENVRSIIARAYKSGTIHGEEYRMVTEEKAMTTPHNIGTTGDMELEREKMISYGREHGAEALNKIRSEYMLDLMHKNVHVDSDSLFKTYTSAVFELMHGTRT